MEHPTDQTYPGHAVDEDGALSYDARCWHCRQTTAQPPPGTTGPLPGWLERDLDKIADAKERKDP